MKPPQTVQETESIAICSTCRHPRESHSQTQTMEYSQTSSLFILRLNCIADGCSCRSYVGLVWQRGATEKAKIW